MTIISRLCKRARGQGWVDPGSGRFLCWSVGPKLEGMRIWWPFDFRGSCWLRHTPFLAHFSLFFIYLFFFLSFLFFSFFSLPPLLLSLSLFCFHFFLYTLFFTPFFFFQVSQSWSFCKLGYSLNRTCSDFPTNFPHTWTFVCWNTKSQVCSVGVSFRVIPSIQLE